MSALAQSPQISSVAMLPLMNWKAGAWMAMPAVYWPERKSTSKVLGLPVAGGQCTAGGADLPPRCGDNTCTAPH